MTDERTITQTPIRLERTYQAPVEDLWDLWTTKDGLEAWWGPEGFRVDIHQLDLQVGGKLRYDMIAVEPEQIEFMKKAGMGTSHDTRGTFVEIEPHRRLKIRHVIDFLPGVKPYENNVLVEFFPEGDSVRMLITVDPHIDERMTELATQGWESQLTKLPAALAGRRN